jgi:hypothetical protein
MTFYKNIEGKARRDKFRNYIFGVEVVIKNFNNRVRRKIITII